MNDPRQYNRFFHFRGLTKDGRDCAATCYVREIDAPVAKALGVATADLGKPCVVGTAFCSPDDMNRFSKETGRQLAMVNSVENPSFVLVIKEDAAPHVVAQTLIMSFNSPGVITKRRPQWLTGTTWARRAQDLRRRIEHEITNSMADAMARDAMARASAVSEPDEAPVSPERIRAPLETSTRSEMFRALHEAVGGDSIDAARVRRMIEALLVERNELRARAERAESEVERLRAAAYHSPGLLFVDLWREASAEVERLRADSRERQPKPEPVVEGPVWMDFPNDDDGDSISCWRPNGQGNAFVSCIDAGGEEASCYVQGKANRVRFAKQIAPEVSAVISAAEMLLKGQNREGLCMREDIRALDAAMGALEE